MNITIAGTDDILRELKRDEELMRPIVKEAVAELAEEAKAEIEQGIISCGAVDTGAMLKSVVTSNNFDRASSKTPMASAEVDYPDLSILNSRRKTPIKNKRLYYAGVVESYQHFVQHARDKVNPKLEQKINDKLCQKVNQ